MTGSQSGGSGVILTAGLSRRGLRGINGSNEIALSAIVLALQRSQDFVRVLRQQASRQHQVGALIFEA